MFCVEIIHKEMYRTTQKELMHPSPSVIPHKTIVQGDFRGWPWLRIHAFVAGVRGRGFDPWSRMLHGTVGGWGDQL